MARTGRPSKYTAALAEEILRRMREGQSASSICKLEHMPDWSNLMRWVAKMPEFRDKYAEARECMIDHWVMSAYDIASDDTRDLINSIEVTDSPKGRTVKKKRVSDNTASQRDRLRVDTILKVAAKMSPKKYGDIQRLEHTGKDGERLNINVTVNAKDNKS